MIRNTYDMPVEGPVDSGDIIALVVVVGVYIWLIYGKS